jgi:hypothetical protein
VALPAGAIEFGQKDRNILQIGQFRKMKKKSMVGKLVILPGKRPGVRSTDTQHPKWCYNPDGWFPRN